MVRSRELFTTRPELKAYRACTHAQRDRSAPATGSSCRPTYTPAARQASTAPRRAAGAGAAGARRSLGARRVRLQRPCTSGWPNRGFAVLSVNFRGSTGFGKAFINAGDLQWGRKMHDDLLDAVDWAVKEGIADASRVAIMGGSYGGYATLAGLAFHARGVLLRRRHRRPSNLETLLATIPPYWAAFFENLARRGRRSTHRGGTQACSGALAALRRRQHQQAAADRPGRQRPARQAGRIRPDHRRHARQATCP